MSACHSLCLNLGWWYHRCPHTRLAQVEVKSARLTWNRYLQRWELRFLSIKVDKLDVLILGVLLPDVIQLWECMDPRRLKMVSDGKCTTARGRKIYYTASKGLKEWQVAWQQDVLPKLQRCAALKHQWEIESEEFKSLLLPLPSRSEQAYVDCGDVLSGLPIALRGKSIANLCRLCDDSDEAWEGTLEALPGTTYNGQKKRGQANSEHDYMRRVWSRFKQFHYLRRVEVKGARLSWSTTYNRWLLRFTHIKPHLFDDLILGVHFLDRRKRAF